MGDASKDFKAYKVVQITPGHRENITLHTVTFTQAMQAISKAKYDCELYGTNSDAICWSTDWEMIDY